MDAVERVGPERICRTLVRLDAFMDAGVRRLVWTDFDLIPDGNCLAQAIVAAVVLLSVDFDLLRFLPHTAEACK